MGAVNPVFAAIIIAAALLVAVRAARRMRPEGPTAAAAQPRAPVRLIPGSPLGWWSAGLAAAYMALLATAQSVPGIDPFDRGAELAPEILGKLILGGTAGAAIIAGIMAARNRGDRSLLVYLGIAICVWVGLIPVIGSLFFE